MDYTDVLNFWYPTNKFQKWWFNTSMDDIIIQTFTELLKLAECKKLDEWKYTEKSCIALIIVLDQFSRHVYRHTNYTINDEYALSLSKYYITNYNIILMNPSYLSFILLPFRHSKNIKLIEQSIVLMTKVCPTDDHEIIIKQKFLNASNNQLTKLTN
jgi:uncharacterized protein (DUF924 family)